ncbi:hypothetical protein WMF04_19985 [Sorangium sp. So ce260]|uniref:hypothetical protein n=1 Tax=Sorangium sp. So ce260 TaxID=3133291 RepID=UPI003F617BF8
MARSSPRLWTPKWRDIFSPLSPEEMVATTSELTMVGGEIVWESGVLDRHRGAL